MVESIDRLSPPKQQMAVCKGAVARGGERGGGLPYGTDKDARRLA